VCVCRIEQPACQFIFVTFSVTYIRMDARTCGAPLFVQSFSQFNTAMLSFLSYRAANSTVLCFPTSISASLPP